jgi:hypothetical protein
MNYRYNAYLLYGSKFRAILARKEVIDDLTNKLQKQGFRVQRLAIKAQGRLKYKNWVYY